MSIRQISVFLENRPGKLYELTGLLARHGIDMRALSIAEATDFGIARIIASDAQKCALALREGQFIAQFSDVLAFAVPDEPGGLHNLLRGGEPGRAYMSFRVTDTKRAEAALVERGLKSLSLDEIERG